MKLHEAKKLLTVKEMVTRLNSSPQNGRKISDKGLITKIYRELKKLNSPKINKEMAEIFQRKSKWQKSQEEILNIPGHKGNANQNHIKILPYSC
jgi:abortive infection bacteriophage resistance protein